MLEFIKKYRNNPERTVLTMECKRSFYVLKKKDIANCDECYRDTDSPYMRNFKTKIKPNANDMHSACNCLNTSQKQPQNICKEYILECENAVLSGNKCDDLDTTAFKLNENCIDLDACGSCEILEQDKLSCDFYTAKNLNGKSKDSLTKKLKMKEKHSNGAFVCKKTKRILLCDFIAYTSISIAALMLACKFIFKRK